MNRQTFNHHSLIRTAILLLAILFLSVLAYGSWNNPNFWRTANQRGDHLMNKKQFKQAANAYEDPWHIGMAQYRNGDFKEAGPTFARVPGADGAFN